MSDIGNKFNFDDVFFRDVALAFQKTLNERISWTNRFQDGVKPVNVPFYYSMTGDERFLLDSFSDDIIGKRVELNTDQIPRGHYTQTGFNIKSDEFANPNVWLRQIIEDDKTSELRKVLAKIRAVPVKISYDVTILVDNVGDTWKCQQSIMNTLWLYRYMNFEYNFLKIDAVLFIPDDMPVEILHEKDMSSDNSLKIKVSIEVHTYYPSFVDQIQPNRVIWNNNIIQR
jgi:hypothetical protein